ncbi:MAG: iron uptake porin [Gloeotrichia echinulata DVL01]|jgi:hypothetical protein
MITVKKDLLLLSGAALLCLTAPALAEADTCTDITCDQLAQKTDTERVTSVSQLSDVQPSDWAFAALQSLVERYGVIAGYTDGTFKGNRALTRYEFAAGLNAALDKINELIAAGASAQVSKTDLETIQKLQTEFAPEIANLRSRIDKLEARTANLEAQQFSTTVRLGGQVIFGLTTGFGGSPPGNGEANTILSHLTQLQLVSSFTGKDRLRVGLVTGNTAGDGFANPASFNTSMARLSWQANYDNQVKVDSVEYRFATLGDRIVFTFKPVGFSLSSVLSVNTPYADAGQGAISQFAGYTPIFKIGSLDAGVGFDWLVSNQLRLQFAYGTRDSNNSSQGIFASDHSALGVQLLYKPTPSLIAGLGYVNAYASNGQLDTGTGSINADTSDGFNEPAQINAINGSVKWQLTDQIIFGAWGGLITTDSLKSNASASSSTYQFSLGLYDPFGRKGDLLALLVGQPPKLYSGRLITEDKSTSMHYEVFYRYLVSDNIAITPGFFIVTDPENISSYKDIFIGAIRTTFSF